VRRERERSYQAYSSIPHMAVLFRAATGWFRVYIKRSTCHAAGAAYCLGSDEPFLRFVCDCALIADDGSHLAPPARVVLSFRVRVVFPKFVKRRHLCMMRGGTQIPTDRYPTGYRLSTLARCVKRIEVGGGLVPAEVRQTARGGFDSRRLHPRACPDGAWRRTSRTEIAIVRRMCYSSF
jgi:hypothetical protein